MNELLRSRGVADRPVGLARTTVRSVPCWRTGLRAAVLGLAACAAWAHAASPLDGSWDVSFSTRDTETRRALVEIAGPAGTWTSVAQLGKEKSDPCVDRPFALAVRSADPDRLVMEVVFSTSMPGCKDRTVTGKLLDSNTIEGKLENGKPLRMIRRAGNR